MNPLPCTAIVLALAGALPAVAQKYPEKTIRLVVLFPTGASQILGLLVAEKLGAALGQAAYADFRPGAGGTIGGEITAKSAPDGYTLMMASSSTAITPNLYKKLSYVPLRDFQPISQVANMPNVLVIHPSVPAKNVKELVALAHASPGKLSYGSGGVGSGNHLARVGIDPVTSTPADFHAFIKDETGKWARVIREAKIRVE